jgi:hypothetical protein
MLKKIYMQKISSVALITIFLLAIIASCSKDNGGGGGGGGPQLDCSTVTNKFFAADVNPIIQSTCNSSNCHATGSTNGPGPITNYTQVFNSRARIRSAIASGFMPRNTTLTTAQKNSILCWIDKGAPND